MQTSTTGYPKRARIVVAFLWQLTLVVGFFALATWLWPADLLETPLSELTLGYVLRTVVSVMFLSLGVTTLYLVAVEPFVRGYAALYTRDHS